jgi:hypothetical protein
MWRDKFRNDSGNPLQPGNAIKNGNFDKATFRILAIALVLVSLFAGGVWVLWF